MSLADGRKAYQAGAWAEALRSLADAADAHGLEPADLESLAISAYLTGADAKAVEALQSAHDGWRDAADMPRAARCACYLGFVLMRGGDGPRAGGWFARAARHVAAIDHPCVEEGYVLLPQALRLVGGPDVAAAHGIFARAVAIGERFSDRDLVVFARHGQARAKLRMGEVDEGLALLDDAMLSVEAGDVFPVFSGVVYCSAIEACREIFDLERARAWTRALHAWCTSQPDLVPYRGECLAQRAELLRQEGDWDGSLRESERACTWLTAPVARPAAGEAYYQLAELHRLRGADDQAEESFRRAAQFGRSPQPGLALLRLAQGDASAARRALARALDEARRPLQRAEILPSLAMAALATGEMETARQAADETAQIAAKLASPQLGARAEQVRAEVLLAEGAWREALPRLRAALTAWLGLGAAYEAARAHMLIGLACGRLGDVDTARLHLSGAREELVRLGARPALAQFERIERGLALDADEAPAAGGLTPRELEVLRLVAAGDSNRAIGNQLGISERTVERHVSNIFDKAGVSSRAAATAFAYQNDLL